MVSIEVVADWSVGGGKWRPSVRCTVSLRPGQGKRYALKKHGTNAWRVQSKEDSRFTGCGSRNLDVRILAGASQVVDVSQQDHHSLLRQRGGGRRVKDQGRIRIGHAL